MSNESNLTTTERSVHPQLVADIDQQNSGVVWQKLEQAMDAAGDAILRLGNADLSAVNPAPTPSDAAAKSVPMQVDVAGRSSVVCGTGLDRDPQKDRPVGCLSKSELMANYAHNSTWVRLRWCLLILIAVGWLAMLGVAIAIIAFTPKCASRLDLQWWQSAVIYQVDVRSFQDTNGDGLGDLNGIERHVDYISGLHASVVHINSIYQSSNVGQYDVIDHMTINPSLGTMEDLRRLIKTMHEKGLKLIMDFIPNQTGLQHAWFNASCHGSSGVGINVINTTFNDYYVWHPGKQSTDNRTVMPPNDWTSTVGGSAWQYDETKKQFYYHAFSMDEPDLNLRNEAVLKQLDKVLLFWLDMGVDGFYIRSAAYLVESSDVVSKSRDRQHQQTVFQSESYALVARWRTLVDAYTDGEPKSRSYPRILIAEVEGPVNQTVGFASLTDHSNESPGSKTSTAHLATNTALYGLKRGCHAPCILRLVKDWMNAAHSVGVWSNWQLGSTSVKRIASRVENSNYINAVNMLLLTLPGSAISYYGDEIGMHDVVVNGAYRPGQLSPMQWSDRRMAGFTNSTTPWMPLADDYRSINVATQLAHGSGLTHLEVYRLVAELRQHPSFQWGDFFPGADDDLFYFIRQAPGFPGFLVAINFGPNPATVDFVSSDSIAGLVPDTATVAVTTANFASAFTGEWAREREYTVGTVVPTANVYLKPGEGVVLRWEQGTSNMKREESTSVYA